MDFFFYIMIMVIVVSLVGAHTIIKTREARVEERRLKIEEEKLAIQRLELEMKRDKTSSIIMDFNKSGCPLNMRTTALSSKIAF